MRPDVWAPDAARVEVVLGDGSRVPLDRDDDGWHRGGPSLDHGDRYGFSLDGGPPLPDPRSRWQPDGVHGLSAVDDPTTHAWGDGPWTGVELLSGVLYELHVGTCTPEGTLDAAIGRLDDVAALGVTAIELMPVAEAMGTRGWGYDGVDLWAVHHAYGGPAALRRFVDAAHQRGLGVLLDVVYNHLGPEGAYLDCFGPYFTGRHATPWGRAVNLDGPGSSEVRRFIVDNARHWCEEQHLDGLRLDATHALLDDRPVHVVTEVTRAVHELGLEQGWPRWIVVEREEHELLPLLDADDGGWGADARWGDDLHHALHAHLTGERDGYYAAFGALGDIATALGDGQVREGEPLRGRVALARQVTCLQNHDQIGNRARGERLSHLVGTDAALAAAALVLLGPGTPLVFQGEEWAAGTPFPYFADPEDEGLAAAIRDGRHEEFAAFGWAPEDVADPIDPATFTAATLDWDEREQEPHCSALRWYQALIALRRAEPELRGEEVEAVADEDQRTVVVRRGRFVVVAHLADGSAEVAGLSGALVLGRGAIDARAGSVTLGPWAAGVVETAAHPL